MTWNVLWSPSAEQDLAEILRDEDFRSQSIRALVAIDADLACDAVNTGESRSSGRRIHMVSPIGIIFQVNVRLQEALVTHVWRYRVTGT